MLVTDNDRLFYTIAIEYMTERLEIARSISHYNGLVSFPGEEISRLLISEIKTWLTNKDGEAWLRSLGYSRSVPTSSGLSAFLEWWCPVCSGVHYDTLITTCECCGREICEKCSSIMDPNYRIGWCQDCVTKHSLTNLIPIDE